MIDYIRPKVYNIHNSERQNKGNFVTQSYRACGMVASYSGERHHRFSVVSFCYTEDKFMKTYAFEKVGMFILSGICVIGLSGCTQSKLKCAEAGCYNDRAPGSLYCNVHKPAEVQTTTYAIDDDSDYDYDDDDDYDDGYEEDDTTEEPSTNFHIFSGGSSSTKKKNSLNPYKSYDDGFEDVYDGDDYDWDRYKKDPGYADGVDDALDEMDEDD